VLFVNSVAMASDPPVLLPHLLLHDIVVGYACACMCVHVRACACMCVHACACMGGPCSFTDQVRTSQAATLHPQRLQPVLRIQRHSCCPTCVENTTSFVMTPTHVADVTSTFLARLCTHSTVFPKSAIVVRRPQPTPSLATRQTATFTKAMQL
jgi:hypothetical protein